MKNNEISGNLDLYLIAKKDIYYQSLRTILAVFAIDGHCYLEVFLFCWGFLLSWKKCWTLLKKIVFIRWFIISQCLSFLFIGMYFMIDYFCWTIFTSTSWITLDNSSVIFLICCSIWFDNVCFAKFEDFCMEIHQKKIVFSFLWSL